MDKPKAYPDLKLWGPFLAPPMVFASLCTPELPPYLSPLASSAPFGSDPYHFGHGCHSFTSPLCLLSF